MTEFVSEGFHHVALVARDARRSIAFYRDLLGFSLVKQNGDTDRPGSTQLYFGDDRGSPGTLIKVIEDPGASHGSWGIGGVHHVALRVADETRQLRWKRRLTDAGVRVTGPYDRGWFTSIYFADPDRQILEIATEGPGFATDEPIEALGQRLIQPDPRRLIGGRAEDEIRARTHPEPVPEIDGAMRLMGIHHVTGFTDDLDASDVFYRQALGLRLVKRSVNQDDPTTLHYFWANYDGKRVLPASDMTLFGWPQDARRAKEGVGQLGHVAFRASDEQPLAAWREHVRGQGIDVTEIEDHRFFQQFSFRSPDGLLHCIATDTPGFDDDDAVAVE